jgi:hypothetical protein
MWLLTSHNQGITYFTNLIYTAVTFAVGSGETAPFVGHNSFLRWEAVQSVGRSDQDGEAADYVAYWSENHVSEDFDMALRLQIAGNIVRLATYHDNEFKEGVSLTIYDELARWEKFVSLTMKPFDPFSHANPFALDMLTVAMNSSSTQYTHGLGKVQSPHSSALSSSPTCNSRPRSPSLAIFLPVSDFIAKSLLSLIRPDYALASGFPFTIMNYFLVGWFNGYLDKFYMESWKVFLGLVVVFSAMGNISLAILRYRLAEKGLWAGLVENFKWMPMFAIFFGGLPFHLNLALLAHMFKIVS